MLFLFVSVVAVIAFGTFGLQFLLKMRSLRAERTRGASSFLSTDRYRPMLRLLSDDDLAFVSADSKMYKKLRARRRDLFRGYLRCLTRDYAHLLAGIREAMLMSGVDRPDLARALAKNRVLFAVAICKVECRLALHATGVGNVDVSALVDALEALRSQVGVLSTAFQTA
jgi:hypothetical protein